MDYGEALRYLDEHENREALLSIAAGRVEGLSLEAMHKLLGVLGDPHTTYPVIHLTGTNGKGSVAAMVEVLLEEHGLVVGTYSSPHVQRLNERMRWTGEARLDVTTDGVVVERRRPAEGGDIDDASFARVIAEIADAEVVAGIRPSYFEVLTAASFSWFADLPVDVAVVEVGLLGAFDATNVVDAQVAVVTNIGHDHTDYEGDWRAKIAREKAGIVKEGSMLVLGERDPDLLPIFEDSVGGVSDRLWLAGRDFDVVGNFDAVGGRVIDLRLAGGPVEDVFVPLLGEHQGSNAALAAAAVEAFFGRPLDPDVVRSALSRLVLPARFEVVSREPLVVIDGAHNVEGAAAASSTLADELTYDGRLIVLVGLLDGRDPVAFLEALDVHQADMVVTTTPPSPRALPASDLADVARQMGLAVTAIPDPAEAFEQVLAVAGPHDAVLVVGSLYVAGAVRDTITIPTP